MSHRKWAEDEMGRGIKELACYGRKEYISSTHAQCGCRSTCHVYRNEDTPCGTPVPIYTQLANR